MFSSFDLCINKHIQPIHQTLVKQLNRDQQQLCQTSKQLFKWTTLTKLMLCHGFRLPFTNRAIVITSHVSVPKISVTRQRFGNIFRLVIFPQIVSQWSRLPTYYSLGLFELLHSDFEKPINCYLFPFSWNGRFPIDTTAAFAFVGTQSNAKLKDQIVS